MQTNTIERDIAELNYMPMAHLKALWQSYYNTPAPQFNKLTLVNKLAYRMQEMAYGGLKQEVINQLLERLKAQAVQQRTAGVMVWGLVTSSKLNLGPWVIKLNFIDFKFPFHFDFEGEFYQYGCSIFMMPQVKLSVLI